MRQERIFWDWFRANLRALAQIKTGADPIVGVLRRQLDHVDSRLMWEKGTLDDGTHDFVISADGDSEVAPIVHRLAEVAPTIPGWQVTRFRPVREPEEMEYEGVTVQLSEVTFGLMASPDGGPYNVVVFVRGLTEENYNSRGTAALLLLEGWMGEARLITHIGEIRFLPEPKERGPYVESIKDIVRLLQLE